jgi:ABC-2 type transport system ATP-binding protein
VLRDAAALAQAASIVARATGAEADVDRGGRRVSAPVSDRVACLADVLRGLEAQGVEAEDVVLRRPTLDDVFLQLTGRRTA